MRDFKGMKRQRGRNRGGGGGKPQQNANRAFDSNGPEGIKVRGNAQHVFEKYQQLARDANAAGDRVLAENYLQHAEHYFRLLRAIQPQRPPSEILGRDQFASGYDIDFEDESQPQGGDGGEDGDTSEEGVEARDRGGWQERPREDRRDERRDERPRDDRSRDDRPRDRDRGGRDRWRERDDRRDRDERPRGERDDRPRDDRPRDERPRDERPRDERPRDERPRDDRRDERPREERRERFERQDREDRGERAERDPLAVVEPRAAAPLGASEDRASPVLRDSEGGESHAPAFLQSPAPRRETASDEEGAAPRRPRRRRTPRAADGGAAPSGETEEA